MSGRSRLSLQGLGVGLILFSLLFSLCVAPAQRSLAKNQTSRMEEERAPASFRYASTLLRNYALTTIPRQRLAGDTAKQNRLKFDLADGGLAPRHSGVSPSIVSSFLVKTEQSVSYLSFRLSRPGGRAPPASV